MFVTGARASKNTNPDLACELGSGAATAIEKHVSVEPKREIDEKTRVLLEDPIVPTLIRLAWPNVLVMLAQSSTGLIEMWYISRLGVDALARISQATGASGLQIRQKLFCDNDLSRLGKGARWRRSVAQNRAYLDGSKGGLLWPSSTAGR